MESNSHLIYTPGTSETWSFDLGEGKVINLFGDLIPSMTQEQIANYTSRDGSRSCSLLDFFEFAGKMYELRKVSGKTQEHVESARRFVRDALRSSFPHTQTRVNYLPSEQDEIVHGYGTQEAIFKGANLIGKNGKIEEVLSLEASLALTGKSPKEVSEIMSYLNDGTSTYIWRLNQKPQGRDERVVGLFAYSGRFYLGCDRSPHNAGASFGVSSSQKILEGSR